MGQKKLNKHRLGSLIKSLVTTFYPKFLLQDQLQGRNWPGWYLWPVDASSGRWRRCHTWSQRPRKVRGTSATSWRRWSAFGRSAKGWRARRGRRWTGGCRRWRRSCRTAPPAFRRRQPSIAEMKIDFEMEQERRQLSKLSFSFKFLHRLIPICFLLAGISVSWLELDSQVG